MSEMNEIDPTSAPDGANESSGRPPGAGAGPAARGADAIREAVIEQLRTVARPPSATSIEYTSPSS